MTMNCYLHSSIDPIHKNQTSPPFPLHIHNIMSKSAVKRQTIEKLENYQIYISSSLISLILLLSYYYDRDFYSKFYSLQYLNPDNLTYDVGIDDLYFIAFSIVAITFVRSVMVKFFFPPIAHFFNIKSISAIQRFKEQSWSLVYYLISFTFGFTMYYKSDYFLDCDKIYLGWPHDTLSHNFKLYYLIQTANWFQQILTLNIEARRKDHYQMYSHHIITCCLCLGSYYYYLLQIGHVILMIMDIVDALFSFAKLLKYCGFNRLCDVMFLIFMTSWIALRHGVYNYILYHAITRCKMLVNLNCETNGRCMPGRTIDILCVLLGGLQILTLIWMYLIAKVALKVIKGGNADDVRSDDEDSDEEEEEKQHAE